jgi:hypothetical protein
LPIDSQPCVLGGKFFDDLVANMCTNPLATNPLCVAESPEKIWRKIGAVFVQNSLVQGDLNLGAEHVADSVQGSDLGAAIDPGVDMLQSP